MSRSGCSATTGPPTTTFALARAHLVHEAAHDYPRRRAIVDAVPDELLRRHPAARRSNDMASRGARTSSRAPATAARRERVRSLRRVRRAARVGAAPRRGAHRARTRPRPTRTRSIPWASWDAWRDAGFAGLAFPEEYGGQGGGFLAHAIAVEEVARVCASSSLFTFISKLGDDAGARPRLRRAEAERTSPRVASG